MKWRYNAERFLSARGVAVIGASPQQAYSRSVLRGLRNMGYPEQSVFAVNPRYDEVDGIRCYGALSDIPSPIDVAAVLTRPDIALAAVAEAGRCGVRAVTVVGAGYSEMGPEGDRQQAELAGLCQKLDIALLGPNTFGYVSPRDHIALYAGADPGSIRSGRAALVFQSSGLLSRALRIASYKDIGLAYAFSVGNEAVMDVADLLYSVAADDGVDSVGVFFEAAVRPRAFIDALWQVRNAGKSVVMVKLGDSQAARDNALAHAGKMASSAAGWQAVLSAAGVICVDDVDELMTGLALLEANVGPIEADQGIGLCSLSGGECGLLADIAERQGLRVPVLQAETVQDLRAVTNRPTLVGNPLDCDNPLRNDRERFERVMKLVCEDENVPVMAARFPLARSFDTAEESAHGVFTRAARSAGISSVALLPTDGGPPDERWFRWFRENGSILLADSYSTSLKVIKRVGDRRAMMPQAFRDWVPSAVLEDAAAVPEGAERRIWSWTESQEWLRSSGIAYVRSEFARSAQDAARTADGFDGEVVVKVVVRGGLAHKSEYKGVALGLRGADQVARACDDMRAGLAAVAPEIELEGFEIQQSVPRSIELLVAMVRDPALGPMLTIGAGGLLAESLNDTAILLPPFSREQLRHGLRSIELYGVLTRRQVLLPEQEESLLAFLEVFGTAAVGTADSVREVELNPVMLSPSGAFGVDVLVTEVVHETAATT